MSAGSDQPEETPPSAARWRSLLVVEPVARWQGWARYGPAVRSWSGAVAVNVFIAILFILGFGPVRRAPPPPIDPIPVQLFVELPEPPEPEPPEPEPPRPAPPRPTPPQPDPEPAPPKPVPPPPTPVPEPTPDLPPFVPLDAQPIAVPNVLGEAIPDIPLQTEATPQPLADLPTFEAEPAPFFEAAPIPVPGPPTPTDVPLLSEPLQQDLPEFQSEPTPDPQPEAAPRTPDAPALPDKEDEDEGEAVAQVPAPAPSGATFGPPPSGIDLGPPPGGVGGLKGLLGEDKCRSREERLRGDCPPNFAGIQRPGNDLFGPDITAGVRAYGEVVGVDESMRRARETDMTRKRPLPNGGVEGLGGASDLVGRLRHGAPDPGKQEE